MAGRGLIARIARHPVSPDRNDKEDRLTEICAAIFDSEPCRDLAWHITTAWLDAAQSKRPPADNGRLARLRSRLGNDPRAWRCQARTQVRTKDSLRRPDLELWFTESDQEGAGKPIVICVEVKHGSTPHTRQLQAYMDSFMDRGIQDWVVLLLAPRSMYSHPPFDPDQVPDAVPRLTWQQTAAILNGYNPTNCVDRFLVDELRRYLREENLSDPEQLTPLHLVALANYREAGDALDRLCEIAADAVNEGWTKTASGQYPEQAPRERWWEYAPAGRTPLASETDSPWDWSWNLLIDSASVLRDGRPGAPCFTAGATTSVPGSVARLNDREERLRDAGFRVLSRDDTHSRKNEYLWRVAYPEDVLSGPDLAAQGDTLAQWVGSALTEVRAVLHGA